MQVTDRELVVLSPLASEAGVRFSATALFAGGEAACSYRWGVTFYGVDDGSG